MPQRSRSDAGRRGFTLVELLVSISIIGVLTGMMMANFRGGQQAAEVRLAADILVNQIRAVQTSALSGRLASVCVGGVNDLKVCEPGKTPAVACTDGVCQRRIPSGYGIRFTSTDPKDYLLFYDTDNDQLYDAGEEIASQAFVTTKTISASASTAGFPLDLVYKPPYGQLYVNGSDTGPVTVSLTLSHDFGNLTRHVNIYRLSGKIEHD